MVETNNAAAEAHQRLMESLTKRFNEATAAERRMMHANLTKTKAQAVGSVRGLKSLFPALKRKLSVTDEGKNT